MTRRATRARVSQDRWLVSYADFITLLFGFFVVLFAFAKADQKKQQQVTQSIDSAFRSLGIFPDAAAKAEWQILRIRCHGNACNPHEYRDGRGCACPGQGQRRS